MRTKASFTLLFLLFSADTFAAEWTHVVDPGGRNIEVRITESLDNHSSIRAECVIPASHERVWQLLTDYDHLEDIIPVVSESRTEGEEDGRLILYQEGRAGMWFVERGFTVRFRVKEVPMAYIGFEAFEGSFKHFTGTWQVDERDGGTWVAHRVEIEPDFYAPGWAVRRVARKLMTETIDGVVTRCLDDRPTARDR